MHFRKMFYNNNAVIVYNAFVQVFTNNAIGCASKNTNQKSSRSDRSIVIGMNRYDC